MSSDTAKLEIFDTTLRDGSQSEDVLFSARDKLNIAQKLDDFGIDFIEGGWPGANPKDVEFFEKARKIQFKNSMLTAFGSTRRAGFTVEKDPTLQALIKAETRAITIFGKTWDLHVTKALGITLSENLELIYDSVRYLKRFVDVVVYDAEHFFDGYRANPEYALQTLKAAAEGDADCLTLCDTNGGRLVADVTEITKKAVEIGKPVGIHCHNDSGLAVANTLAAVDAGAVHIQGTINGIGERCGNADLVTVLPNLALKMDRRFKSADSLSQLTRLSRYVDEMLNRLPRKNQPFVGLSAFAHKGGIHVSAVRKDSKTYEHVSPGSVGNRQRVLVSEQSGKSNLIYKCEEIGMKDVDPSDPRLQTLLKQIKRLEHEGYQFDGAEASFELRARRALGQVPEYFQLQGFRVLDQRRILEDGITRVLESEGTVKVRVGSQLEHNAAEGNGPLNALDTALRKALTRFYPQLHGMKLIDFKVRILSRGGTGSVVRVLIESRDDKGRRWGTVGVSENIIAASYEALVDAVNFKLFKDGVQAPQHVKS
ncbi:MAG: citramalate synthase [Magnetococcales bacterium]|nr:citramalate synthase [Magnetococcales bacterium]